MTEKTLLTGALFKEPTQAKAAGFNYNLEALRGVAAMLVVWHHIVYGQGLLDPSFTPSRIWAFDPPAHLCVLVFFVLSGYVIGLTHSAPLTKQTIGVYLKKRALRLYPIYLISLGITFLFAVTNYPLTTILSHVFMTQAWLSPVIGENAPVWSLHYEVLYYLLFIPLSYFQINPVQAAIVCFVVGITNFYLYPAYGGYPMLTAYAFGFTFWLSGLALARYNRNTGSQHSWGLMVSMLLLLLSFESFNVLSTLLHKVSMKLLGTSMAFPSAVPWYQRAVTFQDFAFLPFCLVVLSVFTGQQFRGKPIAIALLIVPPALTFYSFYKHYNSQTSSLLLLPCVFYITALAFYILNKKLAGVSRQIITRLIPLGGISYALYILHYPVFYLFNQAFIFSGSVQTFLVRLLLYLALCSIVAWFLEKKFQPWIRRQFLPSKPPTNGSRALREGIEDYQP